MKIYHPKYGVVDRTYMNVTWEYKDLGEKAWVNLFKSFSNDELYSLQETQVEAENYETASMIQQEIDKRKEIL